MKLWTRFFGQDLAGGVCPEPVYFNLLEELIRGKNLQSKSGTTELFARVYQRKLAKAGCLDENNGLVLDDYRRALETNKIDPSLLCRAFNYDQDLPDEFLEED